MSFSNPLFKIPRQSIDGMEGMWVKMWDPPTASPSTPDELDPTNPVPEVMAAAGLQSKPSASHTVQRDLLHGADITTWDSAKKLKFFLFRDKDNPATSGGNFPGATIRVPRGVIFHGETSGHGPPPHTIHWHGIEPTPMNDGVGHCSMEVGHYTYQWQPNFIGFYFCHCHRNTVQHFEFGLYQALLIDPADAYFATLVDPKIPIGAGRDGKRRIAANLKGTSLVALQDNFNPLDTPDPWTGDPRLKFPTDPHAMTVPYDVEALWVVDDRDSTWSDLAPNAFATFPKHGATPGVDDKFHENPGANGFFAFNQFNADYWFVTGVPVPAHKGGVGAIPADIVIPPALISGTATQVSISARVGDTILVRALDAAYNNATYRFPVPVTIIAWDGRALGVPPYGDYNHAYDVPANTPIVASVARRFDALIKATAPLDSFAEVDFIDTRGGSGPDTPQIVLCTARIPIKVTAAPPAVSTVAIAGQSYIVAFGKFSADGQVTATVKLPNGEQVNYSASWKGLTADQVLANAIANNDVVAQAVAMAAGAKPPASPAPAKVEDKTKDRVRVKDKGQAAGTETTVTDTLNKIAGSQWTVGATVVVVSAATRLENFPMEGDTVTVRGQVQADGSIAASRIRAVNLMGGKAARTKAQAKLEEVRFKGRVGGVGDKMWLIATTTVMVNLDTKFVDEPTLGSMVEARADKQANGDLLATEIRNLDRKGGGGSKTATAPTIGTSGSDVRFMDYVNGTGNSMWLVGTTPVTVNANTRFVDNPAKGNFVEVRAKVQADGSLLAYEIRNLDKAGAVSGGGSTPTAPTGGTSGPGGGGTSGPGGGGSGSGSGSSGSGSGSSGSGGSGSGSGSSGSGSGGSGSGSGSSGSGSGSSGSGSGGSGSGSGSSGSGSGGSGSG